MPDSPVQSLLCQFVCHAPRHGVADDLPSEHVLHANQIQSAFIRTHIGDVRQPDLARCVGTEVLGQQIGRYRQGVCRVRGRAKAAFLPAAPLWKGRGHSASRPSSVPDSTQPDTFMLVRSYSQLATRYDGHA